MSDPDGYPTDEELVDIRNWDVGDLPGWFAYIKQAGHYWNMTDPWGWNEEDGVDGLGHPARVYRISTGGWSGNEEIIAAMRDNTACWHSTWESTRRGGHYEFAIPTKEARKDG